QLDRLNKALIRRWTIVVIVLFVSGALFALALHKASSAAHDAQQAIQAVQVQRRVTQRINCAVVGAVSQAGRAVISGPMATRETPFTRFLEAHGYPSLKVREARAKQAALAYVQDVSNRVDTAVGGHQGDQIVNQKDG